MFKVKSIETLDNNTKIYDLSHIVEESFDDAQLIAENGEYTQLINVEDIYNYRIDNNFVGVYECYIDNIGEYNRFKDMVLNVNSNVPTLEQWKEGKLLDEHGRKVSLTKWMRKEGIEESVIDFYSQQKRIKEDKYYFTISDLPQHIIGMSYYASNWESCMHPDDENSVHLISSLYDDSLLIGFLHKDMEDLNSLEGNMLARVQFRIMEHEGMQILVPSRLYGDDTNKAIMNRCIERIECLHVLPKEVRYIHSKDEQEDLLILVHSANGNKSIYVSDDIIIRKEVNEYKDIECPLCNGSKVIKEVIGVFRHNKEMDIKCPMCEGTGSYEIRINWECDEIEQVNGQMEINAYCDDYEHTGSEIRIEVSKSRLLRHFEAF